ncbi:MAG TPA: tetratricopeptide repeat protein [Candidatus Koribacter sp.]
MNEQIEGLLKDAALARRAGQGDDAKRLWSEAVALARAAGERKALIRGLLGLAQAERDAGKFAEAITPSEEAVELCRAEGDALLLAHSVRHLGDVYRHTGEIKKAEASYAEAVGIYRRERGTSALELANALRPMALLKEKLGEREVARKLWEEAREFYRAAGVQAGVEEAERHLQEDAVR